MSFWFLNSFFKVSGHFESHRIAEKMRMDAVLAALGLHREETEWYALGGSDDSLLYNFAKGTVQDYLGEKTAQVKRQQVYDGPILPVLSPAVDVN